MPCNFLSAKQSVNSIIVNCSPSFEYFVDLIVNNYHQQAMLGMDPFGHPPINTNPSALKQAIISACNTASSYKTGTGWESNAGSILSNGLVSYWAGATMAIGLGPGMAPNIPLFNAVISGGSAQPLIYTSCASQVKGDLTNTIQSMFWDIAQNHKLTITGLYSYLFFAGQIYIPMVAPWVAII